MVNEFYSRKIRIEIELEMKMTKELDEQIHHTTV